MTEEAQPFIPYADYEGVPASLAKELDAYEARMGFVPNALRIYAHSPHILKQLIRMNNAVMRHPQSVLGEDFKYRISFIISRNHGCRYCCAHHAATLKKKFGLDEHRLRQILLLEAPEDEREDVAWRFVDAASRGPEHVTDELRKELAEAFTPEEVVEIACTLGFWAFYNRVHSNLDIPIEEHLLEESGWVDVGRE